MGEQDWACFDSSEAQTTKEEMGKKKTKRMKESGEVSWIHQIHQSNPGNPYRDASLPDVPNNGG